MINPGIIGIHERIGSVVDIEQDGVEARRGDRRHDLLHIADAQIEARINEKVGAGDDAVPHPVGDFGMDLGHDDLFDRGIGKKFAGSESKAQSTDEDAVCARVEDGTGESAL